MSKPDDGETMEKPLAIHRNALCNSSSLSGESRAQWLTAVLEEYKALRTEILDAIQAQRQTMRLGITGLSVLVGFGLLRIDPLLAVLLLVLLVPTVTIFITAGALGEMFRAARASSFLACREKILKNCIPGPTAVMEWERWLRGNPIFIVRDRAEFFAVFSISTGSLAVGFHVMFNSDLHLEHSAPLVVAIGVVALTLWAVSPILHMYLLSLIRRQFYSVVPLGAEIDGSSR